METVRRAYRLKLYPNAAQRVAMARHAGSCRWLWNHLLDLQQKTHAATGKFVFFHDMSKLLPGLKRTVEWLGEAPSNALVRVCRNLDRALRDSFRKDGPQRGFPKFKVRGKCREAWYAIGQAVRIHGGKVVLPKVGAVRFRSGRLPEGRILGGNVHRVADEWFVMLQCEIEEEIPTVAPESDTVVAVDLGLAHLMVASDGVRVKAPRHLRAAQKRLARAQKVLMRRKRGSANRRKQAMRVGRLHAKVANCRADATHKATRALVNRSSAVVTETLAVAGMGRSLRLGLSVADANLGETLRQVGYKCAWAGKTHLKAARFFASTQTCSHCGTRKEGDNRLTLSQRTFRCDGCGYVADRDDNASQNLRRYGVAALCAVPTPANTNDVGRVTPERDVPRGMSDACGDPSAGPSAPAVGRRGSPKQEVAADARGANPYATLPSKPGDVPLVLFTATT